MKTTLVFATLAALAATPVSAQGRFQTGAFSWTPTITLRDAGLDTNVFDEAANPKRDTVAVVTPEVNALLDTGVWALAMAGGADFVYFDRYTDERSVNRRASARLDVQLSRLRPFVGAGYLDTRERQNAEIDLRARRSERNVTLGTRIDMFSRVAFEASVRGADLDFRQGQVFRGEDLAERLNRESTSAAARVLVQVTPLTAFFVEGDLSRDRFVFRPQQDTGHTRVNAGLEFAPDAIIRGRAKVGYHDMTPKGTDAVRFQGVTASIDISYVLLSRTRFNVRASRDTTYSVEEQPYYLQTVYGGEVLHNVAGPLDVLGRYVREKLDYAAIERRNAAAHTDYLNRYGGGIAIRAAERFRVEVSYEFADRTSGESPSLSFDRRRMYTTVTYGF